MWILGYYHLRKFPIKFFIKTILNLVFYKTNFGLLKFKSPLLKPILNLLN
jgi:hypothetical protein